MISWCHIAVYAIAFVCLIVGLGYRWWIGTLQKKKGSLPGPTCLIPYLGSLYQMIRHPFCFYENQAAYGPISWNMILGRSIVFCREPRLTRQVFNGKIGDASLWLSMTAKEILGAHNLPFLKGTEHSKIKKHLLRLFTPKGLATYIPIQEARVREAFDNWSNKCEKTGKPFEVRLVARLLNVETSISVFLGPYVSAAERREIADMFWCINDGMLAVPFKTPLWLKKIGFPETTFDKAIEARKKLVKIFTQCSRAALERRNSLDGSIHHDDMETFCLLDVWIATELESNATDTTDDDSIPNRDTIIDHTDIALHLVDFLFASQDATTSAITYIFSLLADHPEHLEKVRDEQDRVRSEDDPLSYETLQYHLSYTKAVVYEILRIRPPATMVPHTADGPCSIEEHRLKQGTVILPSIWCSHQIEYENPETFDPSRFLGSADQYSKSLSKFLTFGAGPHKCLGQQYAMTQLMITVSVLCRNYVWSRVDTGPRKNDIVFRPTIFPKDCLVRMRHRRGSSDKAF